MPELNLIVLEAQWDKVRELEDTDAPWRVKKWQDGYEREVVRYDILDAHDDIRAECSQPDVANAIVASRNAVPALIARVREADARSYNLAVANMDAHARIVALEQALRGVIKCYGADHGCEPSCTSCKRADAYQCGGQGFLNGMCHYVNAARLLLDVAERVHP